MLCALPFAVKVSLAVHNAHTHNTRLTYKLGDKNFKLSPINKAVQIIFVLANRKAERERCDEYLNYIPFCYYQKLASNWKSVGARNANTVEHTIN